MCRLWVVLFIPAACAPSTAGKPVSDTGADTVLVPDVLFPQDVEVVDTTAPDTTADTTPPDTADTTPPDTAPPDTTLDTTPPDDTSACPNGEGCNDGDPCTVNDRCEGGRCVGGGPTCHDDLPCTSDRCTGGVCDYVIQSGACAIGGICYTAAQPNPSDACQHCDSAVSTSKWSDIPGCGLGEPCDYHTDCYPERVCARWVTTGETVCSDPCAGAADCSGADQICSKLPGSAQVGFCQPAPQGILADGAACTEDFQCRSGLCEGTCRPLCLDEAHCQTPDHTCHPVGDLAAGLIASVCAPDPADAIGLGSVCSPDGGINFGGEFCASGHCDLTLYPDTNLPCAPVCKSELDCAPAQECNLVLYATAPSPNHVPYDPQFTTRTYDAFTACYNPGQFGPKQVGAPCTDRAQCGSNKCLGLIPGDPTTYCTSFCELDAECPAGMACKLDALNLASTWLGTYPTISSQPPVNNAYTFVRVCKFE